MNFTDSGNILKESKDMLGNSDKILWDNTSYSSMISSKIPSSDLKDENGEYYHQYSSIADQANNLLKAYAESYDEIERGYVDGTREVWVEDKNAEGGIRKLTKEEDLAELDKAYKKSVETFEKKNDPKVIDALADMEKKMASLRQNSGNVKKQNSEIEKLKAEREKLPTDMGKKMLDASMSFKVQYGLSQAGKIDISSMLKRINIFG